jgi:hypothetical protein
MVTAAAVSALPDVALLWLLRHPLRDEDPDRDWLPREHPVIRVHAWLHQSPWGFVVAALLGWGSHLVADRLTRHNTAPGVRARRGWTW